MQTTVAHRLDPLPPSIDRSTRSRVHQARKNTWLRLIRRREGKLASTYYSRPHYPKDIYRLYHASLLPLPSKRTSTGFPLEPTSTVRITLPVYSQACGANFSSSKMHGQIPPSLIRDQVSRLKLRTRVGSAGSVNRKKKEKEKEASLARSNPSLQRVLAMEVAREERDRERRKKKEGVAQVCTCMSRLDNIGDLEGTDNKVMHAVLQDAPYYPA